MSGTMTRTAAMAVNMPRVESLSRACWKPNSRSVVLGFTNDSLRARGASKGPGSHLLTLRAGQKSHASSRFAMESHSREGAGLALDGLRPEGPFLSAQAVRPGNCHPRRRSALKGPFIF